MRQNAYKEVNLFITKKEMKVWCVCYYIFLVWFSFSKSVVWNWVFLKMHTPIKSGVPLSIRPSWL